MTTKAKRITREWIALIVAIGWGTHEVLGDAREPVLILVGGIIAAVLGMRIDDALREKRRDSAD